MYFTDTHLGVEFRLKSLACCRLKCVGQKAHCTALCSFKYYHLSLKDQGTRAHAHCTHFITSACTLHKPFVFCLSQITCAVLHSSLQRSLHIQAVASSSPPWQDRFTALSSRTRNLSYSSAKKQRTAKMRFPPPCLSLNHGLLRNVRLQAPASEVVQVRI